MQSGAYSQLLLCGQLGIEPLKYGFRRGSSLLRRTLLVRELMESWKSHYQVGREQIK
jgi:hypothetical protein